MKTKNILLAMLFCLLWMANSYATETEPNDTKGTANKLNLNNSNTGAIGSATDVDWWKVTTTADGRLDLTLTISNGLYCYYQLYDNNGTTLLHSSYTNSIQSYSTDGLAAGTYFIKIFAFNAGEMPAYTIANALVLAAFTNDVEPNGQFTQALTLPLPGSVTGHVGFYYNLTRDTADWYKVVTTGNGQLTLDFNVNNVQYVYWQLYDGNGTTNLKSVYTNGSSSYSVDGLAAGTYYVKVFPFYGDGFAAYTLTSSFLAPPVANDVEPNNTKGQAKNLPLNSSKTGQVDYYYNGLRDTSDWYKITTTSDGMLKLTFTSWNGQYVYYNLYDNDGLTLIRSSYTNGIQSYNVDGLAAGTYYVKITCFYADGWSSYTLNDSLFSAPVANDVEPNDSKTQATTLAPGTTTGHVGYYYSLKRDTADWYKIVTTKDGQINVTLASSNGQYVYQTLYDNDGTTVLSSGYSNVEVTKNSDGLAAGTYYLKINPYYGDGYVPYTLTYSLSEYTNANDGLNNETSKKAVTLNANLVTQGHVGFRSNGGARDLVDWWKINYTGNSGNLTVSLNWEPLICCGAQYVYLVIYKDTTAAPLFSAYNNGGNLTANLTGLSQPAYYYVKVFPFYSDQWASYNLTPTFTQTNKATITLQTATTGTTCTNGSLTYKCAKSSKPYSVQLYRYGLKYGNAMTVNNTNAFTISSLPPGNYYATVYGDGATGNAKGTSVTSTIVPAPTNLTTTKIKSNKAQLNWDSLACIKYDSIYYRVQGSSTWSKIKTGQDKGFYTLSGLTASTTYEWQIAHVDTGNLQTAVSAYAGIATFTTAALKLEAVNEELQAELNIYPNPTTALLHINFENAVAGTLTIRLVDVTGRTALISHQQFAGGTFSTDLDLSALANGMYTLQVITADGAVLSKPVVKVKE